MNPRHPIRWTGTTLLALLVANLIGLRAGATAQGDRLTDGEPGAGALDALGASLVLVREVACDDLSAEARHRSNGNRLERCRQQACRTELIPKKRCKFKKPYSLNF